MVFAHGHPPPHTNEVLMLTGVDEQVEAEARRFGYIAPIIVDYLRGHLNKTSAPPLPEGFQEMAEGIVEHLLKSLPLKEGELPTRLPPTADIALYMLALEALPEEHAISLASARGIALRYLDCLHKLAKGEPVPRTDLEETHRYFRTLQRKGSSAQIARFAHGESPLLRAR
jgi:hypothetical protein